MRDRLSPRTKLAIVYVASFLLILGLSASWTALGLSDTPMWVSLLVAVFGGAVAVRVIAVPFMKVRSSEEASVQLLLTSMTDRTGASMSVEEKHETIRTVRRTTWWGSAVLTVFGVLMIGYASQPVPMKFFWTLAGLVLVLAAIGWGISGWREIRRLRKLP
ncbi:hypothetical protein ACFWNH_30945 [Rhodococcus qingshengii]|uniref:hypothetical protein n=1 Tax=Actinomycetes TaxID=1760 RepID=UPI00364C8B00